MEDRSRYRFGDFSSLLQGLPSAGIDRMAYPYSRKKSIEEISASLELIDKILPRSPLLKDFKLF
jgi:hypothetical protein